MTNTAIKFAQTSTSGARCAAWSRRVPLSSLLPPCHRRSSLSVTLLSSHRLLHTNVDVTLPSSLLVTSYHYMFLSASLFRLSYQRKHYNSLPYLPIRFMPTQELHNPAFGLFNSVSERATVTWKKKTTWRYKARHLVLPGRRYLSQVS